MQKNTIQRLLWAAFCVHALHFLLFCAAIIFQAPLKRAMLNSPEDVAGIFSVPYAALIWAIIKLFLFFTLVVLISKGLEARSRTLAPEITALVFYSGIFSFGMNYLQSRLFVRLAAEGLNTAARLSFVNSMITRAAPVSAISVSLLLFACGLSVCYKLQSRFSREQQ